MRHPRSRSLLLLLLDCAARRSLRRGARARRARGLSVALRSRVFCMPRCALSGSLARVQWCLQQFGAVQRIATQVGRAARCSLRSALRRSTAHAHRSRSADWRPPVTCAAECAPPIGRWRFGACSSAELRLDGVPRRECQRAMASHWNFLDIPMCSNGRWW